MIRIIDFQIENFKSIEQTKIYLNPNISVLTGVNNSGKTTIIEAIALWVECFEKLLNQARRSVKSKYDANDYVFGSASKYFDFSDINSVRSPNLEDIFTDRNINKKIRLAATLKKDNDLQICIPFIIAISTKSRYVISLENEATFDYKTFNKFFSSFPVPIKSYFSTPLANIEQEEVFVTPPVMQERLTKRHSFEITRNRLYNLYHTGRFFAFQQDLSYILYGNDSNVLLKIYNHSDINHDTRVVMNYTINNETTEKDLALLGSGSLQAIEILLNVYSEIDDKHDLNIILLDEPDSHMHRDIQYRLFKVLTDRSKNTNQIILTTHNESMIRTTPFANLYHIDLSRKELKSISPLPSDNISESHFMGFYPAANTSLIKSINPEADGLDLISAVESEKIIFVEGINDARMLTALFYGEPRNYNRKIMFWILGGVSKILDKIAGYHDIFTAIHNGKSLWEKSIMIFDHDWIMDKHIDVLKEQLFKTYKIKSFVADIYTQESVLLKQLPVTASLFAKKFKLNEDEKLSFMKALQEACDEHLPKVREKFKSNDYCVKQYASQFVNKANTNYKNCIKPTYILDLRHELEEYYNSQPIWKLADKNMVAEIINAAAGKIGKTFNYGIEVTLLDLVGLASFEARFSEWEEMKAFLEE